MVAKAMAVTAVEMKGVVVTDDGGSKYIDVDQ
jgi:hypothetical protein